MSEFNRSSLVKVTQLIKKPVFIVYNLDGHIFQINIQWMSSMDILSSPLPGLLQFCPKVVPTIGERILGPILNQVKYPTTCMSITTFAFKWPNRTSQLCKRESVDKMGGVVTTGMGGICLNWALCLRFVLTIAICLSI